MIQLPFLPAPQHKMGAHLWRFMAPAPITPKEPRVYDVSLYNVTPVGTHPQWSTIAPVPFGVISKATEWGKEDPSFADNWSGTMDKGILRAAYHFYHNNQLFYTSARQAATFANTILKYGYGPSDYFVIDQEELDSKGNSIISISETIDFLYNVMLNLKLQDPSHLIIYSTANLLNQLSFAKLKVGQADWLKKVRIWTAGYPFDPNAFTTVPTAYIPDQKRYGDVVLWQYAPNAQIAGIPGGTDLNWISPNFQVEWSGSITPPPPPPPPQHAIAVKVLSDDAETALESSTLDGVDAMKITTLTVDVPAPPPPPPPPEPARPTNLVRIKWMFERPSNVRPSVYFNKPDILPGRLESEVELTKELQNYWFALLEQFRPSGWTDGNMRKAWAVITAGNRAFTNGSGSEDHADYINGTNLDAQPITMDKFRFTGGAVGHRLQPDKVFNIRTIPCIMVEALDPTSHPDPLKINNALTPWLVGIATIDYGKPMVHVGGFPQLGDNPVQVPFFGIGGFNYIPLSCVEPIADNAPLPSPFLGQ